MKNLLTEKNLMWVAIAALAVLHFCPASICGATKEGRSASICGAAKEGRSDSMRQRMIQMRDRMGSRGDAGRSIWTGPRSGGHEAKGEKKRPKDSK